LIHGGLKFGARYLLIWIASPTIRRKK